MTGDTAIHKIGVRKQCGGKRLVFNFGFADNTPLENN
jgi:hypothetical protein